MNNDGTTSFLIDFTQQMEGINTYRQHSPAKSQTEPNLLQYMNSQRSPNKASARQSYATPGKPNNILNLLDFELPPAPTPRSIPTITVRELESLKSSYLSQISSLKATLSGREAEVESLKRAVGDAERRVGEAQESLREEKSKREWAEQEKVGWEKRGQEVENVLKSVKEEIYNSEVEKEDLHRKIEEQERRVEEAEARATKAEERYADALAARANTGEAGEESTATEEQVQRLVAAQIDSKIEAVSRELHSVYKEKHERKVATLKKSYEARNAQKCEGLQNRLAELEKLNDELIAAKDSTFTNELSPGKSSGMNAEAEAELKAQLEEQRAHLARLENEMQTSRQQQEQLMHDLEQERIEKGDLVAAVDEMLLLQSEQGPAQGAMSVVEDFRKSISRPTGLRAPGGMAPPESRIGRSMPSGLARAGSNAGKSKILSSIERMGRSHSGSQE
jgi:chromosome segregation ATPase